MNCYTLLVKEIVVTSLFYRLNMIQNFRHYMSTDKHWYHLSMITAREFEI